MGSRKVRLVSIKGDRLDVGSLVPFPGAIPGSCFAREIRDLGGYFKDMVICLLGRFGSERVEGDACAGVGRFGYPYLPPPD